MQHRLQAEKEDKWEERQKRKKKESLIDDLVRTFFSGSNYFTDCPAILVFLLFSPVIVFLLFPSFFPSPSFPSFSENVVVIPSLLLVYFIFSPQLLPRTSKMLHKYQNSANVRVNNKQKRRTFCHNCLHKIENAAKLKNATNFKPPRI